DLQRRGRAVDLHAHSVVSRILCNREDGDAGDSGHCLPEQFQPFSAHFLREAGEPSDVLARPREANDEAAPNGIAHVRHHDRYGSRRPPERDDRGVVIGNDRVGTELDQLLGGAMQPVGSSFGPTVIDENVLALYVATLAEALPEGFEEVGARGGGDRAQVPYPRDLRRQLRIRDERSRANGKSEGDYGGSASVHAAAEACCEAKAEDRRGYQSRAVAICRLCQRGSPR